MIAPFPRSWVDALTVEQLERLAIRTVDGTMDDVEALKSERLVRRLWVARAKKATEEQEA